MENRKFNNEMLNEYLKFLVLEERSEGTIQKYRRDICAFADWIQDAEVSKETAAKWKEHLVLRGFAPATINSMLAAINTFFKFMGWHECTVRFLKIQRKLFRDRNRELTEAEFKRLVETAECTGRKRLALLLETMAATGIRVSEVKYITVEATQQGRAEIALKGKIRTILLSQKLCRKLMKYAKKNHTVSGEIFLTRNGKGLTRKQIWAEMKSLCESSGVEATKVFPHNLRHLFATAFYRVSKDIVKLADVLGHSSVETTRIYLITTGEEHLRHLERLGLVS